MLYKSTRGEEKVNSAQAILQGIAADGGLFVPEEFPVFDKTALLELLGKDYFSIAETVLRKYLTDYTAEEIKACVKAAYNTISFPEKPVVFNEVKADTGVLELWHGPTFAFKDMALQLLPRLLTKAIEKTGEKKEVVILVATSGDTGKAALEGFANVEGTRIVVFYPVDGVSDIQKKQMVTQQGDNVAVVAVEGNFDDAQTGVKKIFANKNLQEKMAENGFVFSSANSINWGRLVPQIVYYFKAYASAVKNGGVQFGEKVNFVVPTGNFGNILAGYYAKCMGLPVAKFICASNANNVLAEFINTGRYNKERAFHKTISPSMDILVSSNLERMLYQLAQGDSALINNWMKQLAENGEYDIGDDYRKKLGESFCGYWINDSGTQKTIAKVFTQHDYLLDTHTAVAWQALEQYREATGDNTYAIVVSTASPFKFAPAVLAAIKPALIHNSDAFAALQELSELSGLKIPKEMQKLKQLPALHDKTVAVGQMEKQVETILGI